MSTKLMRMNMIVDEQTYNFLYTLQLLQTITINIKLKLEINNKS